MISGVCKDPKHPMRLCTRDCRSCKFGQYINNEIDEQEEPSYDYYN